MSSRRCFTLLWVLLCVNIEQALSAVCYRTFTQQEFPNCQLLSQTYALHWKVDVDNTTFAIDVDESPSGWVGLGISEAGGMKGADIWLIQKNRAGVWTVGDMHSHSNSAPLRDTKQDASLVGTPVVGENTIAAVITRKLKACDVSDLTMRPNVSTPYIWAHAAQAGYHGPASRGTYILQLIPDVEAVPDAPTKSASLVMPNISVPSNTTSYMCMNFEVPADRKYHILYADYNISSDIVHHLLLFGCFKPPSQGMGKLYECSKMPQECVLFNFAWVPGVTNWVAPKEAGFPMHQFYGLQIHYNNVQNLEGMRDSSGITLRFSATLRKYDIGVLGMGQFNLSIPGRSPSLSAPPAVCPSECTAKFTSPLIIINHLFHLHTLGKSVKTQRIRNGQELEPLGSRASWDFNYQVLSAVNPGAEVVIPGDAFITTCTYDSTNVNTTTVYGSSTYDEMCFDDLIYYPAQNITSCLPRIVDGFATCANDAPLGVWFDENLYPKMAAAPPAPKSNAAEVEPTPVAPAPAAAGIPYEESVQLAQLAVDANLFVKYDPAKYMPGGAKGYKPYVPADGCPAFLSTEDNAGLPEDVGVPPANDTTAKNETDNVRSVASTMYGSGVTMLSWLMLAVALAGVVQGE